MDKHAKSNHEVYENNSEYVPFVLENYITNPVVLMRIKSGVTQEELAEAMNVSLAYIDDLEKKKVVATETLDKVDGYLKNLNKRKN